jgi:hypothetical protein
MNGALGMPRGLDSVAAVEVEADDMADERDRDDDRLAESLG